MTITPNPHDGADPSATEPPGGEVSVIGQIQPLDCSLPVPEGWCSTDIWWAGEHRELVYEPGRYTVIQARPGVLDDHLRADLTATGWRHFGTDSRSCELWVLERNQAELARLDGLREVGPSAHQALSVA